MSRNIRISLPVLVTLGVFSAIPRTVTCQDAAGPPKPSSPVFHVSVTDAAGHAITGLRPSDFTISIEGLHPTISYFSNRDIPASVGILFDMSKSMQNAGSRLDIIRQALVRFAEISNPADRFFIVTIRD